MQDNDNFKSRRPSDGGNKSGRPPIKRHMDPYHNRQSSGDEQDERSAIEDKNAVIEGKNAVIEAIRAGIPLDKVFVVRDSDDRQLAYIASTARERGTVVVTADRRKLDNMSVTHSHQGVIAQLSVARYVEVSDILDIARERGEAPLIVVCDEISDPHNLGAIIRTAEAAGAHGVIIPKRRSAGLVATVAKTSAGAAMHLAVARVTNITAAIGELKKNGVWVFGAAADGGTMMWDADFIGPTAIVIGSEGAGLGRLVAESCDFSVRIPMFGKVSSLNASVCASIFTYEAVRQRRGDI